MSWRRVGKLLALSFPELLLLVQAGAGLLLTRVLLATRGYDTALRVLTRLARIPLVPRLAADEVGRAQSTARLVYAAGARFPLHATCLPKSLVLWSLLTRQDIASELRIGVRLLEGRLEGHAWVEHAGVPLSQDADVAERFKPFPSDLAAVRRWVGSASS